ncbi:MAG: ZIP family metal transporter [archaeon]|nr:ZIP family metal transporter [archaeon]MCR4323421.1 ZIP family metal transporter [Nanoarchaeota archaeon]
MNQLTNIILATIIISLISLVGVAFLSVRKKFLKNWMNLLVSFAAGAILATVFLNLAPESFKLLGNFNFVLMGIVLFFILEAGIHWHHHHEEECEDCLHPVVFLTLIGDAFHNFLDGVLIAASFLINVGVGISTTIAIGLHEIPQEIGDFAILVNGGLKRSKALLFNFLSALFALVGGIVGFFFLNRIQGLLPYVVSLAAGGLLYIATTDVLPNLHEERNYKRIISQILAFIFGILAIAFILRIFPE